MSKEEDKERWHRAAHAVQSGVLLDELASDASLTAKHLRTGLNCIMSDHGALAYLLIRKGVITEEEYLSAIADQLEQEKRVYEAKHGVKLG